MPVSLLEVPKGIRPDAKKKLVQKMKAALNEVWPIPDVRVFFREYEAANVAQDGVFEAEQVRPICFLNVPLLRSLDAKRNLARTLHAAFALRGHRQHQGVDDLLQPVRPRKRGRGRSPAVRQPAGR